jgi:hypothetical protein
MVFTSKSLLFPSLQLAKVPFSFMGDDFSEKVIYRSFANIVFTNGIFCRQLRRFFVASLA